MKKRILIIEDDTDLAGINGSGFDVCGSFLIIAYLAFWKVKKVEPGILIVE
ncbi:MAG: hypothetical protein HDR28_05090 [Lachnospiraceae bacterium]|nr:hypothetical protein [Lachnospiraceae bacterium]